MYWITCVKSLRSKLVQQLTSSEDEKKNNHSALKIERYFIKLILRLAHDVATY